MKLKLLTVALVIFYVARSYSQNTSIPDPNFEQALIDLGYDDVIDGSVLTANINTVNVLNITSKNISDLTGIEDFIALGSLNCSYNNLSTLDFSSNINLFNLNCISNNLTTLNVSSNNLFTLYFEFNNVSTIDLSNSTFLSELNCGNNSLTNLDLSQNRELRGLICDFNNITSLDLSNIPFGLLDYVTCSNNNLEFLNLKNGFSTFIDTFDAKINPNLICVQVDDVNHFNSNWYNKIDAQTSFNTNCLETYVPDDNFEQALIDLGLDSGPLDDYVLNANINTLTNLDVSSKGIIELRGLEGFLLLENLDCSNNGLYNFYYPNNTILKSVDCSNNQINFIGLATNTSLTNFNCDNNPNITEMNLSANTLLTDLSFKNCGINDLILTTNTALINLHCEGNNLTTLDLSTNVALTSFTGQNNNLSSLLIKNNNNTNITIFNTTSNPNLTCIEVDNPSYSSTNWTNIDSQTIFNTNCAFPQTYVPDNNFEQKLIDSGYDIVLDDYVLTSNINTVANLFISSSNISDLTGIEDFNGLTTLDCNNNQLTNLDVSNNTLLTSLDVSSNDLTSLNISANTALTVLDIGANDLTSLDVSSNILLSELICSGNDLLSLDVSSNILLEKLNCNSNDLENLDLSANNGLTNLECRFNNLIDLNVKNGNNLNIYRLYATNNPNLVCINVDDAAYSSANWTVIDSQSVFSENCNASTYIPDNNFEQALIDLGYDTVLNNYVFTNDINTITNLDLSNKGIFDLTGIEDFTALTSLNFAGNGISSIDLSQNTQLTTLLCSGNYLTTLDLSFNTNLEILDFGYNSITEIDLSSNTLLKEIECQHNGLTSLDLTANTTLTTLKCIVNNLTDLDLSANSNFTYLYAVSNDLSTLKMNNGNNTNVTYFNIGGAQNLTCIQVDDPVYSLANWAYFTGDYSLNCHYGETYVPDDNFEQSLINLGYDTVLDDYVTTSNINSVTNLSLISESISDLTGIEDFVALQSLSCSSNSLIHLNVSNLTVLTHLECQNNNLESLIVKNGYNTNMVTFNATNNPSLTCIEVDDVTYSSKNWTNIDSQTNFSLECFFNDTFIPDNNFEQALIDFGYDSGPLNNYIPTLNIEFLDVLDVSNKNIMDLTGIEAFTALTFLNCSGNSLNNLNVSSNPYLRDLNCANNFLTDLNLLNNTELKTLNCYYNNLTDLSIFSNTALISLNCNNNNLTDLNLFSNTALTSLDCSNNNLTDLNLDLNVNLISLGCTNNSILNLDLSTNTALTLISCSNNDIESIDVSSCTLLETLYSTSSKLTHLDLSANVALEKINVTTNLLTSLDLSNNTKITNISCDANPFTSTGLNIQNGANSLITNFSAVACPTLICIKVDDAAYSTVNWENIDAQTSFGEDCFPLTYVPDDNFEQALITMGYDSGSLDNYLFTHDINTITNLDISNLNIQDVTGIEDFIALTTLNCANNSIENLDLSKNTALTSLNCSTNNLERLNMQNGNALNVTAFDATNNLELDCIQVNDVTYSEINWTNIDSQTSFNIDCHYGYTYVPDDNFEQALHDILWISEPLDNYIKTSYIENLTSIIAIDRNITDLTGIEDFKALEGINCANNNLTSLDLSNNPNLKVLIINDNNLTSLDLTNNIYLEIIELNYNNLTTLDISPSYGFITSLECQNNNLSNLQLTNKPSLSNLNISGNNFTALDFSNVPSLNFLTLSNNNFTELNLSSNPALISVRCDSNDISSFYIQNGNNSSISSFGFNITNNPNLKCVLVDDQEYSTLNWTNIDVQTTFNETECHYGETYIPDNNFEQALIDLGYDTVLDDYVITSNINTITSLSVNNLNINDLTGIEDFTALQFLNCGNNNLNHLDVSSNLALQTLICIYNNIGVLNVSKNVLLTSLGCFWNNLTVLDVKNGNNLNFTSFNSVGNPQLTCIQVDDAKYSTTNWTNIDASSNFNNSCSSFYVYVPDNNFEQALIDLGYDTVLDNYVDTNNIDTVESLNLINKKIYDLTGIEAFDALSELACNDNNLTELDISSNANLTELYCSNNKLETLNTSSNPNLSILDLAANNITDLDVSLNINLTELFCDANQLISLDLSSNTMLVRLNCNNNFSLISLNAKNGNNNNFISFSAVNNPNLACIEVDNATYSTSVWTSIDETTSFGNNCLTSTVRVSIKSFLQGASINPNTEENGLMRDNLRETNLIPTTSPYLDGATCFLSVFNTVGNDAIVDWVWVELRDKNDNTIILESKSALIKRNGYIVESDGISPLSFMVSNDDYYISVGHRNHLGILSANTFSLTNSVTSANLSNSITAVYGGTNAVVSIGRGNFALYAGDYDGNSQIQNTDTITVIGLLGNNNYSNADADLNGHIQITDINNLITPNIGKGEQYKKIKQDLKLHAKRKN